ncbi:MAG TPA: chitobiase/beta-hexosaminidase C-terminal domain-containing protein [Terriglobales bacterium]|nr:chitobiase/beta-hexosaminidase C-terminal domain-containing protein [Acidobacteriaceae bacterium]HKR30306.1 chitobiase/beta-hexosaminidase C-terminal domain-containing protein [Terriglobales bacterium]
MLHICETEIRRTITTFSVVLAFLLILPVVSAQSNPGQQAAAQAAQEANQQAVQDMQAANRQFAQAMQDASQQATLQQENEQAIQAAQRAAMNRAAASPPSNGYGRADKPSFSPRPGTFSGPVRVTISDPATPKAEIFYTLDGSEPTTASTPYTGPVLVTSSTKLRAIARSPIYSPSRVAKARYVIR